ncbi:YdcF family protein [Ruminococcaceae bacterium OttesenSCG-928-L11]|nr:YdcF family protein [Ruminococcaceae bacterium OttesenSCG-928-L11]
MIDRLIDDITNFVFMDNEIEKADIIFIPGGSHPELGEYAARLFVQGYAKYVLPAGGVSVKTGKFNGVKSKREIYNKEYKTEFEFLSDVLIQNGVPSNAIIREDQSSFTKENAVYSKRVLDSMGIIVDKAILCCKSFHARRAFMFYQFAFPDTEILVHSIPYFENGVGINSDSWHKSEVGINRVMGEIRRYGEQFMDDFIGLL